MIPDQYADLMRLLMRLLGAVGDATDHLADRLDRMEEREAAMEAIIREINGDSAGQLGSEPKPRRRFRPTATVNRI